MAAPDEHLRTSPGYSLSGAERAPVEEHGDHDLDNLQYGTHVAGDRDPRASVTAASIATVALCGWAWTAVGRDNLLVTLALLVPMVIALGALLTVAGRQPPRVGIQISQTEVMVGKWPGRTYRFPRAAVAKVKSSNGPWMGSVTELRPDHDFRLRGHHYLQITLHSADTFCVAADPNNNPVNDRIIGELGLATAQLALMPKAARTPKARPPKAQPSTALSAPSSAEKLWESATAKHDEILLAYLPYETEPPILMRYPALTDITHPATAGFHEAMEEANALRTDTMPSDSKFAGAYRDSVRRLAVAWATAERAAKREGTTYLDPADRRKLEQAAKLLRHAESAESAPERAVYLRQVKSIMDQLVDNGAIHAPPKIVHAIEAATTLAIEAADRNP